MRPRKTEKSGTDDLFRSRLDQIIDMRHELVRLTVVVEMVVDRSVDGGELLQGLDVPEFRHRSLSSSERLV